MSRTDAVAALAAVPPELFAEARAAARRLLVLDFDGTLAPFVIDRAAARPLPSCRAAIGRLIALDRSRLAIISGRPPRELVEALGELPIPMVGEHGWTIRAADGALLLHPLAPGVADALARAADAVAESVALARIERKRASIVVHTRGLDAPTAEAAEKRATELFAERFGDPRLEVRSIDGGLELRARGHDKGTALVALVTASGEGTLPVVLGDDEGDEDAFRAARALGGWAVLVGRARATAAQGRVDSPAEVAELLDAWAERVDAPSLEPHDVATALR